VYGGHENLEAVEFLKALNLAVYRDFPDTQTVAEESTAWPMVSRPTYVGGLGFGLKWNMGWMHDTLKYFQSNPVHRKYVHNQLTFSLWYAFTENYVLPLSHDEVVHGKGSLIGRMPGDEWQQFANLRLLLAYMWAHPGKKMLFMGGEFGQKREWHHDESLEWHVLEYPLHAGLQRLVRDLNRLLRRTPALCQLDFATEGFQWVDANNSDDSVLIFLRKGAGGEVVLIAANFTPVPRPNYRVGAPFPGTWRELLNSDAADYGGSGIGNFGAVEASPHGSHGQPCSLTLQLPPLALVILAPGQGQAVAPPPGVPVAPAPRVAPLPPAGSAAPPVTAAVPEQPSPPAVPVPPSPPLSVMPETRSVPVTPAVSAPPRSAVPVTSAVPETTPFVPLTPAVPPAVVVATFAVPETPAVAATPAGSATASAAPVTSALPETPAVPATSEGSAPPRSAAPVTSAVPGTPVVPAASAVSAPPPAAPLMSAVPEGPSVSGSCSTVTPSGSVASATSAVPSSTAGAAVPEAPPSAAPAVSASAEPGPPPPGEPSA
jgi:1,4-alpha-glucan branching enzyme